MPPFDVPALTRGVSGLFTARDEGKRSAEERARKQQRLVMADLLSQRRVDEFVDAGRARRQKAAKAEEDRLAKAEEVLEGQRRRAEFIKSNLSPGELEGIVGFEEQGMTDQLKTLEGAFRRQRAKVVADARIAARVPRTTAGPKPFAQDARVRRVVSLYARLLEKGLNPEETAAEAITAGRFFGESPPVDTSAVKQQAMLEATDRFRHEFTDDELPELTSILDGIVGETDSGAGQGEVGGSDPLADIEQQILQFRARGLSPKEIQTELAKLGFNVRL